MTFSEYIEAQFRLTGKIDAYIEVKALTHSKSLTYLLDQMIRNTFVEKDLLKLEYDNQKLEKILEEHDN